MVSIHVTTWNGTLMVVIFLTLHRSSAIEPSHLPPKNVLSLFVTVFVSYFHVIKTSISTVKWIHFTIVHSYSCSMFCCTFSRHSIFYAALKNSICTVRRFNIKLFIPRFFCSIELEKWERIKSYSVKYFAITMELYYFLSNQVFLALHGARCI